MNIKIEDLVIEIQNRYPEIEGFCHDYLVDDAIKPDFTVCVTDEEREKCKNWFLRNEHINISEGMAEYDWMKHNVHKKLPEHDAFWLHACVVEMDGDGYAFTAPSGYGKTTHAAIWLKEFGDKARVINGDNPIILQKDGVFYAYGTPWGGKEGWSVNTGVPLKAVCYINHSNENFLNKLEPLTAYYRLLEFSKLYQTSENLGQMMALYEAFVDKVPFYQMNCNMEPEAARVSYEGMSGKKINIERSSETGKVEKK